MAKREKLLPKPDPVLFFVIPIWHAIGFIWCRPISNKQRIIVIVQNQTCLTPFILTPLIFYLLYDLWFTAPPSKSCIVHARLSVALGCRRLITTNQSNLTPLICQSGVSMAYGPLDTRIHVSRGDIGYISIPPILLHFHAAANSQ